MAKSQGTLDLFTEVLIKVTPREIEKPPEESKAPLKAKPGKVVQQRGKIGDLKVYKPVSDDPLDEMFAKYVNESGVKLEIQRLSKGKYLIGSQQTFLKIMNGHLIVRIGGGFTSIEDYLKNYAMTEMIRASKQMKNGG